MKTHVEVAKYIMTHLLAPVVLCKWPRFKYKMWYMYFTVYSNKPPNKAHALWLVGRSLTSVFICRFPLCLLYSPCIFFFLTEEIESSFP